MKSFVFLLLVFPPTDAMSPNDPQLCYILDGFLGLYGLIITGMFIKEKFFRSKVKFEDDQDPNGDDGGYTGLVRDSERGQNRWLTDDTTYQDLNRPTDGEYKELPVKRERKKKNEQIYQGLSSATRDTYDALQMLPLPPR
ncbi:T-cell surface glycoprotein CD3 zeta chain-like isoform X2 [Hippoglossus hippoglossus]|uniref:T-cell surface glycoprotein CD3 zeta chain-like isoform X2 n=1 Tax=Hippoglossus hippoglossus TaxID=8267 RepID=UPI00148B69FE|nr:T-cell surface glycoprotein CD3 zeta chain-like isoform X2 [Hippoglossus hippoglossus]